MVLLEVDIFSFEDWYVQGLNLTVTLELVITDEQDLKIPKSYLGLSICMTTVFSPPPPLFIDRWVVNFRLFN